MNINNRFSLSDDLVSNVKKHFKEPPSTKISNEMIELVKELSSKILTNKGGCIEQESFDNDKKVYFSVVIEWTRQALQEAGYNYLPEIRWSMSKQGNLLEKEAVLVCNFKKIK